jgi:hypothetical protein
MIGSFLGAATWHVESLWGISDATSPLRNLSPAVPNGVVEFTTSFAQPQFGPDLAWLAPGFLILSLMSGLKPASNELRC